MSHAEIWDDSALVESWNEALMEYEYYHSLHARGEKVEVPHQSNGLDTTQESSTSESELHSTAGKSGNCVGGTGDETETHATEMPDTTPEEEKGKSSRGNHISASGAENGAPPLPQHLIGSVHDEGLKNLLMSWYYAGYYTGLYEGQQQVRQEPA